MLTVVSCITTRHDITLLLVAAAICIFGSTITTQLYSRARRSPGLQRLNWIFMAGIIGGSTIWTTHFIAMLSFSPSMRHAFAPDLTMISLLVAIATTLLGLLISTLSARSMLVELGGAVLGGGIVLMHFIGMAAYEIEGRMVWDRGFVLASIVLGVAFGVLVCNRMARPLWSFCRHASTASLILAIITMHFTAMTALTIEADPTIVVSAQLVPDAFMAILVSAVTGIIISFGTAAYFIDAHAQESAAERFRHLSMHDALTGLPNRASLVDYIDTLIAHGDEARNAGVIKIALDRLKEVSDGHGFTAADALMRGVAVRLGEALGERYFLARGTGETFAIVCPHTSKSGLLRLATQLIEDLQAPISWEGGSLTAGPCAGIAMLAATPSTMTAEDLLTHATLALDRAQQAGAQAIRVYDRAADDATRTRSMLSMAMQCGLERGEFFLVYQAQNDVETRETVGYEALLRWRHPELGLIPPSDFIPLAERSTFINRLGDWVLLTAAREASGWTRPLSIAVNVAPAQLADSSFPARVQAILTETGLDAARLELEITESGIIADQRKALAIIQQLKGLGVRIAMDDYGTGYSSLATLQNFPFDKIKIDRSFVDAVTVSRPSAAIVRSTIILAQSLDIPVLAEGVETEEQMAFLQHEGCCHVQGYLFGRPQIAEDIAVVTRMTLDPPLIPAATAA
ncbi:putative bifunctional diguanylate cyclase/phosphodiesterase [Xaviernesmea oryzae]|uniref:putative bifunctional diguanylate cyclase/phosphodiesterase n=1 Tax=Xaviernesmea oryzae TaxID=464029 RepID=UPI0008C7E716|nr:EAL domain-containing protein [Xaviernesmea oryzae]SEL61475.1 diguanylate cyclase (GGDEF) domain-containing protein [Xaviernesmea oryzae]